MPELPEVETIKRYLVKKLKGRKIKDIIILNNKSFYGDKKEIVNSEILNIKRRGKILIFKLKNNLNLVFHMKMSGQLLFFESLKKTDTNEIVKHSRAIFNLDKGLLIFKDTRKFGWVKILNNEELNKELKKLGKEPLVLNFKYLKETFSKSKRPIKVILMDQSKIAGIGNIYANEILFLAKIYPLTPANKLKDKEIKNLLLAIKKIIQKAIKLQGTSFRSYLKPDKSIGSYQEKFLVYQRKNKKCFRCKNKINYIKVRNRGSFYCSSCQKLVS